MVDRTRALAKLRACGLYVLFDPRERVDWRADLGRLRAAGVEWFQLRMKHADTTERSRYVAAARAAIGPAPVLIVNDDVAAVDAGADGVHLGPQDLSPAAARAALGPNLIVGSSGDGPDRLTGEAAAGVDYFGIGAFRGTASKPDAGSPIGGDGLRRALALIEVPGVAIGGLEPGDARVVRAAGAAAMAVYSAIWHAPDPASAAIRFLRAWQEAEM